MKSDSETLAAVDAIVGVIKTWKCSYVYVLREDESAQNSAGRTFTTTWSKPSKKLPAPPAVVNIHFVVSLKGGVSSVEEYRGA